MRGPLYNRRQMGIGGQTTPNQALGGLFLCIGLSIGKFGLGVQLISLILPPCFFLVCQMQLTISFSKPVMLLPEVLLRY